MTQGSTTATGIVETFIGALEAMDFDTASSFLAEQTSSSTRTSLYAQFVATREWARCSLTPSAVASGSYVRDRRKLDLSDDVGSDAQDQRDDAPTSAGR